MECSEKYIEDEGSYADNFPFGEEFQQSQAKQGEIRDSDGAINWESMKTELYAACGSVGLVTNPRPESDANRGPVKNPKLCKDHPRYNAINAPRAECSKCWDIWDSRNGREGYNHG